MKQRDTGGGDDKGKTVPVQAMKVYEGSGGVPPSFLNLGTIWRWEVNFTPLLFSPTERHQARPLDRMLGWLQRRSGRFGEANLLLLPGIEQRSLGRIVRIIVNTPTTLPRLRRWEDNIEIGLGVTVYEGMGCIYLARNRTNFWIQINTVIHPGRPKNRWFITSWKTFTCNQDCSSTTHIYRKKKVSTLPTYGHRKREKLK